MAQNLPNILPSAISLNKKEEKKNERESAFDERNYLNLRLKEGESQKQLRIRLLPMDLETGNPFLLVHQHNVKVPTEVAQSGYKSYICPEKTDVDHALYGGKCPFCEINRQAYKEAQTEIDPTKKKELTKLSLNNRARPAQIARCIDRDHEDEGVKYIKINVSTKEDDLYNQIINLWTTRMKEGQQAGKGDVNILDLYEGYDLIITVNKGGENTKGNTYAVTDAKFSTPLSTNEEQMRKWIYDPKSWLDVFKIKPYDYLSIISIGEVPWFDRNTNQWVSKTEIKEGNAIQDAEAARNIEEASASFRNAPQPQATHSDFMSSLEVNNVQEDLPF